MTSRTSKGFATAAIAIGAVLACVGVSVFWGWALESHDLTTVMCLVSGVVVGHFATRAIVAIRS